MKIIINIMINQNVPFERETLIIKSPMLGSFGSKLTFTIGTTYLSFGFVGFLAGAVLLKKPLINFPSKKLMMTYYLNSMMQKGLSWANNSGGAAFMYCLTGWGVQRLFEEEIGFMSQLHKNILAGALTGMAYKSTLGFRASLVGGVVGVMLIGTLHLLTDEL